MQITANSYQVIEGTIVAPYTGAWSAEIQTRAPLVDGDAVTLSDGTVSLSGTVVSGGGAVSRTVARIVGGSGGLANRINPLHRKGATVGAILGAICSAAGEGKSPNITPGVSLSSRTFWSQPQETAGASLSNLAESGGWTWRILQDGKVWMGDGSLGSPVDNLVVLEPHPEDRSYDVAPDGFALWVGSIQNGLVLRRVEYSLSNSKLRCTYWI